MKFLSGQTGREKQAAIKYLFYEPQHSVLFKEFFMKKTKLGPSSKNYYKN
jgi:hypothetical protein